HLFPILLYTPLFSSSPFFFATPPSLLHLLSFPTRRSSDLLTHLKAFHIHPYKLLHIRLSHHSDCVGKDGVRQSPLVTSSQNQDGDRKSTRLNSSHVSISYAVFGLKKKTNTNYMYTCEAVSN